MMILNSKLAEDTLYIGEFPVCTVLLMNNALYPWVILVPKIEGAVEIMDLTKKARTQIMEEVALASSAMRESYWPDKINIASLGNVVEQLHIHVIARFKTDDCWPEPVWGKGAKPYGEEGLREAVEKLRREFDKLKGFKSVANRA